MFSQSPAGNATANAVNWFLNYGWWIIGGAIIGIIFLFGVIGLVAGTIRDRTRRKSQPRPTPKGGAGNAAR